MCDVREEIKEKILSWDRNLGYDDTITLTFPASVQILITDVLLVFKGHCPRQIFSKKVGGKKMYMRICDDALTQALDEAEK